MLLRKVGYCMDFTKIFAAGQDYIFLPDRKAHETMDSSAIKLLCDRKKGIGADGIFTFWQTDDKTSQIKGFCQNGEIMQDLSTASICAAFVLFSEESIATHKFQCHDGEIFTVAERVSGDEILISCDTGKGNFDLTYPAVQRKTQLGNRILTLTALELHGIHTVHFSECKDSLNLGYLGERVSECSLFKKRADFIVAQKNEENSFDMNYYGNKKGFSSPALSCFAAMALAACKTENARYDKEIKINCNSSEIFAACKESGDTAVQCTARKVFEGKI